MRKKIKEEIIEKEEEIKPGEICECCAGKGTQVIRTIRLHKSCPVCCGEKKTNWLEKVVGKKQDYRDRCEENNIEILMTCLGEYMAQRGQRIRVQSQDFKDDSDNEKKWLDIYMPPINIPKQYRRY
jgi:hypothetical protein